MDGVLDESYQENPNISDVYQCDGADSIISSMSSTTRTARTEPERSRTEQNRSRTEQDQEHFGASTIPVWVSESRQHQSNQRDAQKTLKVLTTNPRVQASSTLPVVAVANVRSLLPKLSSVLEKIENEEIEVAMLVEVWEKTGKKIGISKTK